MLTLNTRSEFNMQKSLYHVLSDLYIFHFQVPWCQKSYTRRHDLKVHKLKKHTPIYRQVCIHIDFY